MTDLKNPYGWKDGRIVYVDDVENGLDCGCICPECEQPLIARQGDIREHHFAHWGSQPCEGGQDTTLHLLAVQILKDELCVMFPPYKGVIPAEKKHFKSVEKETLGLSQEKRPDVIGTCDDGTQIYISICCTSDVDEDKRRKIIESGLIAFEIHVRICPINESELREFLLNYCHNRKWFNHPEYERRYQEEEKRKEEERHKQELEQKHRKAEENARIEEERRQQEHERRQREEEESRRMESHRPIMQPSLTDIKKDEISETKNKARGYQEEPKIVPRPTALPLQDGPIKDYYERLHPHSIFNEYTEAETKVVNFGLSYSRNAIFVIHVNMSYKGVRFPFHISRITYGTNGYEYEHIGSYRSEQTAEWRYLKLKEEI